MRKEQRQKVWPWAAIAFLIGPVFFSACSLFGLNIGAGMPAPTSTPEPTLVATLALDTATPSAPLPSGPTLGATRMANTPLPSPTAPPLATPPLPVPIATQAASAPYAIQLGSPRYLRAFDHAEAGCQWFGVAGQVLDAGGNGAGDVAVFVSGSLDGLSIQRAALTTDQSPFGPGGYEILLADHASSTPQTMTLQLYNTQSQPLSDPVKVVVPNQCDQNLLLVNFAAGPAPRSLYFPVITR